MRMMENKDTLTFKGMVGRGGKSTHILYSGRCTDTCVNKDLNIFYSGKSKKIQALKCTQSIKVKSFPLKTFLAAISVQS